mmetsp:Transcript_16124/g.19096  ORF Transcript_16124/g.19096 Transcript_16124/m.19096 type:complete len:91 (-) Transcript_16124:307-579(-)
MSFVSFHFKFHFHLCGITAIAAVLGLFYCRAGRIIPWWSVISPPSEAMMRIRYSAFRRWIVTKSTFLSFVRTSLMYGGDACGGGHGDLSM